MKFAFLAAALSLASAAYAQKPFAPVETWEAAVAAGDESALAKLYSPDAATQAGTARIPLKDELAFWMHFKAGGITEFKPRLLESTTLKGSGHIWLVLRLTVTSGGNRVYDNIRMEWAREGAREGDGWKIVLSRRAEAFAGEKTRTLPQPSTPNVNLYSDPGEAEAELKAALSAAAKGHKRVIVVFGGNWCYDCHVLDTAFHSRELSPLVEASFIVVHINIGDDLKDNREMADRLGVVIDKGVPSLGVLNADGTVVFAQKNGEFEDTVKFGPADVKAFLEKWKPRRG
jgi:ketosteroid isomerase-like protein/thiol-disulfide isomerase/thioredoxin